MHRSIKGLIIGVVSFGPALSGAAPLSMDSYLDSVRSKGSDYRSMESNRMAARLQMAQGDQIFAPQLQAQYYRRDDRETPQIRMYGTRSEMDMYNVGVYKQFSFGPSVGVQYGWDRLETTESMVLKPVEYLHKPKVQASIPLWRNFAGKEWRGTSESVKKQLEGASTMAAYGRNAVVMQARVAYGTLALAREEVRLREEVLNRTEKLDRWSASRVKNHLSDKNESLQTRAAVQVRRLELKGARERERRAAIEFDRLRGGKEGSVPEALETLDEVTKRLDLGMPAALPERLDLKAARLAYEEKSATERRAVEGTKPDLSIYGSYTPSGRAVTFVDARRESWEFDRPIVELGAKLTVNLDLPGQRKIAEGNRWAREGAKRRMEETEARVRMDWEEVGRKWEDVQAREALAREIALLQKEKAERENEMLRLGRTTQFQVLSYENDYLMSSLNRVAVAAEKLGVWAQAQWFLAGEAPVAGASDREARP